MKKAYLYALLGTAAAIPAGMALASGTPAGTDVNNTATIAYATGGVTQAAVNSNTATFKVDHKVNLSVAETGGLPTLTAPGGTAYYTTFTVTNTSNATIDFALIGTQDATGVTTAFGARDTYDQSTLKYFVDSNGNGIYDATLDTATFIDELAADATRTVFIVSDTPAGLVDGSIAGVTLTATASAGGTAGALGATLVQSTTADVAGVVDIVFADGAGDTDAARDGKFSDDDVYKVVAPTLSLAKTSTIISDPFTGVASATNFPKRIPGAIVEYCIIATNTGAGDATSTVITDSLSTVTGVTYVPGSIYTGVTVTSGACNADGSVQTDAAGDDAGTFSGNTVTANVTSVAAGTAKAVRFRVSIN